MEDKGEVWLSQQIHNDRTTVSRRHDGSSSGHDGDESEYFPVTNGVRQGCVLAPTLFSIVFSGMVTDAFHDCQDGRPVIYGTDDGLFNLRRLKAATKEETVIRDVLFPDD